VFSELGNFFLAMGLGFVGVQIMASLFTMQSIGFYIRALFHSSFDFAVSQLRSGRTEERVPYPFVLSVGPAGAEVERMNGEIGTLHYTRNTRYMALGRAGAFLQGGFIALAFLTLVVAFWMCDFSLRLVSLHDHTQLPWYYRMAASWGNHEGSLLLFILILSSISVALAVFLKEPLFRARTLTVQGFLTILFLLFLMLTSNPFTSLPVSLGEGQSLNPLLQDRGLLMHPPLLYVGYVGFSAPFSLAVAALWGGEDAEKWAALTRPWVLFAWSALTFGITLGSWWAYYELGWGGWWFWDPVENASFMPWLAGTALLHTLRTGQLYRWSLFLSLLTFGLSLLGTFLVRSGAITSIHSFAQDPERGMYVLGIFGLVMGFALCLWLWKAPRLHSQSLVPFSRQGALALNSLLCVIGLGTVFLGTFYPLWSEFFWGKSVAIGAPYFERTFIPLMLPLLILLPIGCVLRDGDEPLLSSLSLPLTAVLGVLVLILYIFYPLSLWAFVGILASVWVLGGTGVAYCQGRLSLGPTLAHIGVGLSLLGVSVGGGLRTDATAILGVGESLTIGSNLLTLNTMTQGREPTYLYERASLSYDGDILTPEKRLYQPRNVVLSKTAIHTNGWRDLYVMLGVYQGDDRWLVRASLIPLAPWIWIGGLLMVVGGLAALGSCALNYLMAPFRRVLLLTLFFSSPLLADNALEQRAITFYQEVRCPVCLGQSIADSETDEAQALKTFILDALKNGESEDIIREKLRISFGDDILLRPPFKNHTLFLWLMPFVVFVGAFGLVWRKIFF
jgi:cytochrome c-type biogenesis protein CcmF